MTMKLAEVVDVLRGVAPERLAEPWDKAGLALGALADGGPAVTSAMLCIDLTESVLDEAIKAGAGLVVAYHPPIFQALDAVTDADPKQRIILRAARAGLAIYSPHTALDAVEGGTNDFLADGLGEGKRWPIAPRAGAGQVELVVFVPAGSEDRLREAMSEAGAGRIGEYTHCTFGVAGEGTFKGGEHTRPVVGEAGRFERVQELRMETICPRDRLAAVVDAIWASHPYEEPAYFIYPIEPSPREPVAPVGAGRVVELDRAVSLNTLAERVKQRLGVKHLEVGAAPGGTSGGGKIKRVGLCVGAGASLLAKAGPIDAFITGEMRHHDQLAALAGGCAVLLAGHTQTERPYLPTYRKRIEQHGGDGVDWRISRADRAPTGPRG